MKPKLVAAEKNIAAVLDSGTKTQSEMTKELRQLQSELRQKPQPVEVTVKAESEPKPLVDSLQIVRGRDGEAEVRVRYKGEKTTEKRQSFEIE